MRRPLTAAVAAILCAGLAACSTTPDPTPTPTATKETTMTPAEAKAKVTELYQATIPLIAAQGWSETATWTTCPGSGDRTLQWNFLSSFTGDLPEAPDQLILKIEQAWKGRGLPVKLSVDTNLKPTRYVVSDPPYLSGSNSDGSLFQLYLGTGLADFRATSACVAGDIVELNG